MTRRIIAFPMTEGKYLISQEFNGTRNECMQRNSKANVCVNWPSIVARFKGVRSEQEFRAALQDAEAWYGYELTEPEILDALPDTEECWAVQNGHLVITARYGEPVANMSDDPDYYSIQDDVKASLHELRDGRVYMMMDRTSYMPMLWADGRHNYAHTDYKMDVGQVSEFLPMFGNKNPVATAMMRIK